MNENFFTILLIVLVTVNVILIGAAIVRAFFRRRRQRLDGPRAGSVTRPPVNRGVLAAPMTDGQSQTTRTDGASTRSSALL